MRTEMCRGFCREPRLGHGRESSCALGAGRARSRSTLFLFLLCHDGDARPAHDHRHGALALADSSRAQGKLHAPLFCSRRSRGLVLAFRGYCLDFPFSVALSDRRTLLMSQQIVPLKTYVLVFVSLIGLTLLTTGVAFIDLGAFNTVAALVIAFCKMLLVIFFFMHLRHSGGLVRVVLLEGFFWLALLISLTMSDYRTRSWTPPPDAWPTTAPPT